jgi:prepilin-type N-terminal cleavage/methylation domain-containing protein
MRISDLSENGFLNRLLTCAAWIRGTIKRKGFTLIEILLVTVLIALASTIIGIRFFRNLDRTALRSAGQKLLHMSRYAQLLAGQHQQPTELHINLDKGAYWLTRLPSSSSDPEIVSKKTDEPQIVDNVFSQPGQLPDKVRFSRAQAADMQPVTGGEITIKFYTDGTAQAGLIQLSSRSKTFTVLIHPRTARAELKAGSIEEMPLDVLDLDDAGSSPSVTFK